MDRPPPHDSLNQGGFFRPPPRPSDSKEAFKNRVAIFGLNGELLLGSVWRATNGPVIERPVLLNGHVVATVRMVKLKPVPSDVETHFLTAQYQSMLVVAAALLLVAAWVAHWAAGQVVRPLIQIQTASEHIAQGKLDTRLQTQRSDELGDTMRNINRMAEGLQQLEASRRHWIANMSHELRTPLTVLRGEIDALVDGIHSASPATLLSLREEVLKLNALVDDLHNKPRIAICKTNDWGLASKETAGALALARFAANRLLKVKSMKLFFQKLLQIFGKLKRASCSVKCHEVLPLNMNILLKR